MAVIAQDPLLKLALTTAIIKENVIHYMENALAMLDLLVHLVPLVWMIQTNLVKPSLVLIEVIVTPKVNINIT